MKHKDTQQRRELIHEIIRALGPNTNPTSRHLTEAELADQSTHFLRATIASTRRRAQETKPLRCYFTDGKT